MSPSEALEIINEHGLEFELSDAGFDDGSKNIYHDKIFDSEKEAKKFIKALQTLVNYIEGEI